MIKKQNTKTNKSYTKTKNQFVFTLMIPWWVKL